MVLSIRIHKHFKKFLASPEDSGIFCEFEDIIRGTRAARAKGIKAVESIADSHEDVEARIHASLVLAFMDPEIGWPKVQSLVAAGANPLRRIPLLKIILEREETEIMTWPAMKGDLMCWLDEAPDPIAASAATLLVSEFDVDVTSTIIRRMQVAHAPKERLLFGKELTKSPGWREALKAAEAALESDDAGIVKMLAQQILQTLLTTKSSTKRKAAAGVVSRTRFLESGDSSDEELAVAMLRSETPDGNDLARAIWDRSSQCYSDPTIRGAAMLALAKNGCTAEELKIEEKIINGHMIDAAAECVLVPGLFRADRQLDLLKIALSRSPCSSKQRMLRLLRLVQTPDALKVFDSEVEAYWLETVAESQGWDLRKLGLLASDLGVLSSPPSEAEYSAVSRRSIDSGNLFHDFTALLEICGALFSFDLESDELPPSYVKLLEDMSETLRALDIKRVKQRGRIKLPGQDPGQIITFTLANKSYRFVTGPDHRDYFDIDALLPALNKALVSTGGSERIHLFFEPGGGDCAFLILGKPNAVHELSTAVRWRVEMI